MSDISEPWERLLTDGECWRQEVSEKQTISFLKTFFDTVERYFQNDPHSHKRTDIFGERITSSEVILTQQLRSPKQEDLVSPQPWEDLDSVLSRVAHNMHYQDPTWLLISLSTPRLKIYSQDVPILRRPDDYRLLEHQLKLDKEEIYQLTLHHLTPHLQHPIDGEYPVSHVNSDGLNLHPYLTDMTRLRYCSSLRNTKVCPVCLEEEIGYDRLFWRLDPVVLCPEHALLLIDSCPQCQAPSPVFVQRLPIVRIVRKGIIGTLYER